MRRDNTSGPGWKKRKTADATDAAAVFRELQRRQLKTLAACRTAWEVGNDPLAVAVAATLAPIPEWLTDAIVVLLTIDTDKAALPRKLWKQRRAEAVDAIRAAEVAGARSHPTRPVTWELAIAIGKHFAQQAFSDMPVTSPAAAKRSYYRVKKGLKNRGRYYAAAGFTERREAALIRLEKRITSQLKKSGHNATLKK